MVKPPANMRSRRPSGRGIKDSDPWCPIQRRVKPDLWELANAYAAAGKKEETIRMLLKGVPSHEPGLLQIRVDPDFDLIRDDPRYAELVRQIGFPSE